jgi:alpha-mannosidase
MLLFGFGDGGGGPDMNMIERLRRERDVDGLPKVTIQNPTDFFNSVANTDKDLPVWVGELVRPFDVSVLHKVLY